MKGKRNFDWMLDILVTGSAIVCYLAAIVCLSRVLCLSPYLVFSVINYTTAAAVIAYTVYGRRK